jgi:phosphoribosylformylglycinamidine synthase
MILQRSMNGLLSCIKKGYIAACHDVSEGGLAICLAEMAIGGDCGATVDISMVGTRLRIDVKLFSESNTRWVVEVKKEKQSEFEKLLKKENVQFWVLGTVGGAHLLIQDEKNTVVDLSVDSLRECWRTPIWKFMG